MQGSILQFQENDHILNGYVLALEQVRKVLLRQGDRRLVIGGANRIEKLVEGRSEFMLHADELEQTLLFHRSH